LGVIVPVLVIAVKSLRNAVDGYTIINITTLIGDSSITPVSTNKLPLSLHLYPSLSACGGSTHKLI